MASEISQDEAIRNFAELTGASAEEARNYLTTYNWDLTQAMQAFYDDEEDDATGSRPESGPQADATYTGPRTLDGRPAPQSSSAPHSAPSRRQQPASRAGANRAMTLGDLAGNDEHDHDDDDDHHHRPPRDLFAGGEKSGLAVQDPTQDSRNLVQDILAKARREAERGSPSDPGPTHPAPSRHWGSGQTLGGEGVPSRTIPDPRGSAIPRHAPGSSNQGQQVMERTLHIWQDGFSVDDGPLHRHDDPRNAETLRMIASGRVPLNLMNINFDDAVDVKLVKHDEPWHQLPRIYRPFSGEGRRLGSPVPGDPSSATAVAAAAPAPAASSAAGGSSQAAAATPSTGVDESQPTLAIRIQLPNGTRLPARFNATQTVGDIYEFVQLASPETRARNWVLATTFPNKEHIDRSTVLGEMAEFKKGGTAVVKWV